MIRGSGAEVGGARVIREQRGQTPAPGNVPNSSRVWRVVHSRRDSHGGIYLGNI